MTPERIASLRETLAMDNWSEATDAEMAELLTLAERYLWLRRNPSAVFASVSGPFGPTFNSGDRLDAAIDAAMKGGD